MVCGRTAAVLADDTWWGARTRGEAPGSDIARSDEATAVPDRPNIVDVLRRHPPSSAPPPAPRLGVAARSPGTTTDVEEALRRLVERLVATQSSLDALVAAFEGEARHPGTGGPSGSRRPSTGSDR